MTDDAKSKRWLTTRQLQRRYGDVSHMWPERRLKDDPDFPRPVKFKRFRMWDEAELDAWDRICAARGRAMPNDRAGIGGAR